MTLPDFPSDARPTAAHHGDASSVDSGVAIEEAEDASLASEALRGVKIE